MKENVVNKVCVGLDLDETETQIMSKIDVICTREGDHPTPRRY